MIPNLQRLTTLRLAGPIFTQNLFPKLRQLPLLATLELNDNLNIPLVSLESILHGPEKIERLQSLKIFVYVVESRGGSYLDADHEFKLHWAEGGHLPPRFVPTGWVPPYFRDELPRADVETFVRIAKQAGVEVGDHLQRAMEIEDAYEAEVEQCEIYSRTEEGMARLAVAIAKWEELNGRR